MNAICSPLLGFDEESLSVVVRRAGASIEIRGR